MHIYGYRSILIYRGNFFFFKFNRSISGRLQYETNYEYEKILPTHKTSTSIICFFFFQEFQLFKSAADEKSLYTRQIVRLLKRTLYKDIVVNVVSRILRES